MRNFILKAVTWFMGIVWLICLSAVTVERPAVFLLIFGISTAWLVYFAWANDSLDIEGGDEE